MLFFLFIFFLTKMLFGQAILKIWLTSVPCPVPEPRPWWVPVPQSHLAGGPALSPAESSALGFGPVLSNRSFGAGIHLQDVLSAATSCPSSPWLLSSVVPHLGCTGGCSGEG